MIPSKWLKTPLKSFRMLPNGPKCSWNSTELLSFFLKLLKRSQIFRQMFNATVTALKMPHKSSWILEKFQSGNSSAYNIILSDVLASASLLHWCQWYKYCPHKIFVQNSLLFVVESVFLRWRDQPSLGITGVRFYITPSCAFLIHSVQKLLQLLQTQNKSIEIVQYTEFLVTPKFGVLLRIRSNWAKHSEFTPKFGAPRLGHHFCSLNGWKILSRGWDMTKWRCL